MTGYCCLILETAVSPTRLPHRFPIISQQRRLRRWWRLLGCQIAAVGSCFFLVAGVNGRAVPVDQLPRPAVAVGRRCRDCIMARNRTALPCPCCPLPVGGGETAVAAAPAAAPRPAAGRLGWSAGDERGAGQHLAIG